MHKTCAFLFNAAQMGPLPKERADAAAAFEALFRD